MGQTRWGSNKSQARQNGSVKHDVHGSVKQDVLSPTDLPILGFVSPQSF